MTELTGMTSAELTAWVQEQGYPSFRGKQIFRWIHQGADFEEQAIQLIAINMQSPDDAKELCDVIDTICPFLISKRTSAGYLTENLVEMYQELAGHCGIPKTCFALLKSIETNPDSPYINRSFYLKTKVQYFYDHYVLNVGKVLRAMNDANFRDKFIGAYENKCRQYKADAGMEK